MNLDPTTPHSKDTNIENHWQSNAPLEKEVDDLKNEMRGNIEG